MKSDEKLWQQRKRLYQDVRDVVFKYPTSEMPRKEEIETIMKSPYPSGEIRWEVEFKELEEISRFFGLSSSSKVYRD